MKVRTHLLLLLGLPLLLGACTLAPAATATPVVPTATSATSGATAVAPATATGLPAAATATTMPTPVATIPPAATVAPTAAATLAATATPDATATAAGDSGVQALLDYFTAVNNQDYALAYSYWADGGAASGQSYEDFARGYADTVEVTVLLGNLGVAGATAGQVTVPIRVLSVVNVSETEQAVRYYQGTYDMEPADGHWVIARAAVSEDADATAATSDVADPVTLLQSYVRAINFRGYASAYTYWGSLGRDSQQTFAQFHTGFAGTERVSIDVGEPQSQGAAGSIYADVAVVLVATHTDGTTQSFCGTYSARRANVPPFEQFGWRIVTATVKVTADVTPGSDAAKALLTDCQ